MVVPVYIIFFDYPINFQPFAKSSFLHGMLPTFFFPGTIAKYPCCGNNSTGLTGKSLLTSGNLEKLGIWFEEKGQRK